MEEGIVFSRDGAIATATINRPDKRNAMKMADLKALHRVLEEVEADKSIRALILTGAGDRAFSAGVDLSDVGGGAAAWDDNPLRNLCDRIEALPRVTIARINGAVIGGAAEVALACDFRVGVDTAKVMVPAAKIGIHYEPAGLRRAMAVVGMQAAKRIYLLCETIRAEELHRLGFFDNMVDAAALDGAVAEIAEAAASSAPLSVDGMKLTIMQIARGDLDMEAARARIRESWSSEDMKEGLAAVQAGRKADFKGR
ncbi:MAG: enoyl-CoA hydratase/isomerase family protein [Pseudomonadota bacterium]